MLTQSQRPGYFMYIYIHTHIHTYTIYIYTHTLTHKLTFSTKSGFSKFNMSSCSLSPRGPATLRICTYIHTHIFTCMYIQKYAYFWHKTGIQQIQYVFMLTQSQRLGYFYVYVHTYIYPHVCIYRNMLTFGTKSGFSKYNMSSCSLNPRGPATLRTASCKSGMGLYPGAVCMYVCIHVCMYM
jgi:hypothetical protein